MPLRKKDPPKDGVYETMFMITINTNKDYSRGNDQLFKKAEAWTDKTCTRAEFPKYVKLIDDDKILSMRIPHITAIGSRRRDVHVHMLVLIRHTKNYRGTCHIDLKKMTSSFLKATGIDSCHLDVKVRDPATFENELDYLKRNAYKKDS